ncbi:Mrp/NBP35 family ATP-binding protein [Dermabacter hominis]|uniref:Mrp/NBP35 family ATP-binding protein n=1 Tax=Dermabacter hominis TaxID=36740 RepID=UPI0021A54380|nr:Mrp/NBP35 family ATP-binding protein [Dermabacter hominis]MCT1789304.1 Mrp/NBP35 family ATP-binding protein [Dermabacter hominis]
MSTDLASQVRSALTRVIDPDLGRPITDVGMVSSVEVTPEGVALIHLVMTVEGCPMRSRIEKEAAEAASHVSGLTEVRVTSGTMSEEQRRALVEDLRKRRREVPFNKPGSLTRVIAISSGKGGVGKSTVTANLALALTRLGYSVGVLDADIHGFSMPGMFGVSTQPTRVNDLLMPPIAHGVKVMSIGVFVPEHQAVVWRGPKMHRAIEQFATDVFWGDLDFLLLDLPPGTGDVAISVAQVLPTAELLVVTTPDSAASGVASRIGSLARSTEQTIIGVIENMSWLSTDHGERLEIFGSGGGERVAAQLSEDQGADVPLLGQVPLAQSVREGSDAGRPHTASESSSEAYLAFMRIAEQLAKPRGLSGRKLPLSLA